MTVINTSTQYQGRFTKLAHAVLICIALIRLCGLLYIIVGTVMIVRDGVLQHATFPLLNQFVVHGMPLGDLSSGLVYGLFFILPLHTIFGYMGLIGVFCHNKLVIIIYNIFLIFGIIIDVIFITLFSLVIDAVNSWIKYRFIAYYEDYSAIPTRLNAEVYQAFRELFDAMDCKGAIGSDGPGCWDKYYPVMNGIPRVFILLLSFSIVLEITTLVLLKFIYPRLGQPKYKKSIGMYKQLYQFVRTSFKTSSLKCVFAVVQVTDVICSAMLFIGGIVITQSRFVTDSRLLPIFVNMRFLNYYLPDIVLGLGVTMIFIGCFNIVSCVLGFIMLCFKSSTKSRVGIGLQLLMIIIYIIGLAFWIVLLQTVYEGMMYQLYWEFLAYGGTSYYQMLYTRAWNSLFVTYSCCGVLDITKFRDTNYGTNVPYYCRLGATIANSKLDYITVPPSTNQNYFNRVCETPLKDQIQDYAIFFGVVCGISLILKFFNFVYLYKYGFDTDSANTEPSTWQLVKGVVKNNKCLVAGFSTFTAVGLLISLGILITGSRLYVDDILGNKDIKVLFSHIYIFGRDVTSWVSIMSKIMVSIGCVSFVIFCIGIVSTVIGMAKIYYVAVVALLTSLLFKLISVLMWIPVRVSFDWDLRNEMYSALHAYYKTDLHNNVDAYLSDNNLGFNTLFYQGKCCLRRSSVFSQLYYTFPFPSTLSGNWPWTCSNCVNDMGVRWPFPTYSSTNLCPTGSPYSQDCVTTVLDDTLHRYDTTAVVFSCIMMLLEVMLIIVLDRAYKVRVDPGEGNEARGLFSHILLNNRFINEETMPKCKHLALALCLFKSLSILLQLIMGVGIIMEKFEPGHFDGTEQEFLNNVFSGDVRQGYVTHALGILMLILAVISVVISSITIFFVLRKWRKSIFAQTFSTIVFVAFDVVILGLLSRVLDVAYCCNDSPNCSYRTDTNSDTFQQFCTKVYHDQILKVIGVAIAYVIIMIILQIVCIVLSDRLYKRLQEQSEQPPAEAYGIFTSVWKIATDNRFINEGRMPNYTNLAAVFMTLKGIIIVIELTMWGGIIRQKMDPYDFYTTEDFYLNKIDSGDLTLGYVTHGTAFVMFVVILLSWLLGILGCVAVFKGWRKWIIAVVIVTLVFSLTEIICLGLLSLVLSVAYCCDYGTYCTFYSSSLTMSFSKLCTHGFQGAVYNVIGSFIGLIIAHLVLQVVTMGIGDRIYKRISINLNKENAVTEYGLFATLLVNSRFINQKKMPDFTSMVCVYVVGNIILTMIDFAIWTALIVYVHRYDTQLDGMYVGTLYLSEMTRGASITLIVFILVSMICNMCKVFWSLRKNNTGLRWTTLPEILLFVVDIVILGLYAQLLESIRLSDKSIYQMMYVLTLSYLCVNIAAQLVLFVIKDRLHKRIEKSNSVTNPSGIITWLWRTIVRHRFFTTDSGKTDKTTLVFCFLSWFLVLWEIGVWIVVLLQAENPGYLQGIFRRELDDDAYFWRVLITVLVMEWVYIIFHVITVIGVIRKGKPFLYAASVLLGCILVSDIIILGLVSHWLDKAYNCSSSSEFCSRHNSKLLELCGAFVGLDVLHMGFVGILFGLSMYQSCTAAASTTISPFSDNVEPERSKKNGQSNGGVVSARPLTGTSVGSILSVIDS